MTGPMDRPAGDEHAVIGELVFGVARLWRRAANQALDDFGLSHATASPLLALWRLGGEARQGVVADKAGLEGPSMVRIVDLLLAENLVTRREDTADRRAKILTLTPTGMQRVGEIRLVVASLREELLVGIDDVQLHAAAEVLRRLESTLEAKQDKAAQD